MTAAFVWDHGTPAARTTSVLETDQLLSEMEEVFTKSARHLVYSHKWRPGDFIISDNAALGHEASPETQAPKEKVGLRVMHRTTVQGTEPPEKKYKLDPTGHRVPKEEQKPSS